MTFHAWENPEEPLRLIGSSGKSIVVDLLCKSIPSQTLVICTMSDILFRAIFPHAHDVIHPDETLRTMPDMIVFVQGVTEYLRQEIPKLRSSEISKGVILYTHSPYCLMKYVEQSISFVLNSEFPDVKFILACYNS